tara:strand:+ start:3591 stop:4103 length:513 start_codon:yes stop_codon:yes gene_type:complete
MANVSNLAGDGINPQADSIGLVDGAERPAFNQMVIKFDLNDIPLAANTYILGKLPVGAAITRAILVVDTAFSHALDIGISDVNGAEAAGAGTDGNLDVLLDGSQQANTAKGVYLAGGEKASGKMCGLLTSSTYVSMLGHLCETDSYIVASPATNLTTGAGTLVVEYIKTL